MNVGDIVRVPAGVGGFRVWRIAGIYLGALYQEGVVELETLDYMPNTQGLMFVPVALVAPLLKGEKNNDTT